MYWWLCLRNTKNPETNNETFIHITESGYDISGKWYSYHDSNSNRIYELDLKKDGTFTSTWLDNGSYSIENEKVILADTHGLEKTLELQPENTKSDFTLLFTISMGVIPLYNYLRKSPMDIIRKTY